MTCTLTALYETHDQAERVRDQLVAAHLGDHVTIRDQETAKSGGHRDIVEWIGDIFGGHHDSHLYAEGVRRGHVLLTAKVDVANETRAAALLDAAHPIDLDHAETSWHPENWIPRPTPDSKWTAGERASQGVPDAEPPATRSAQTYASAPEEARGEDSYPASVRITRVRVYALYD